MAVAFGIYLIHTVLAFGHLGAANCVSGVKDLLTLTLSIGMFR
jgi:hypothetical protein